MSETLDILVKLNVWYRDWQRARDSHALSTLKLALESCHALVELEDVKSDRAILLHERVKSLYQNASGILANRLQSEEIDTLMTALASARVYYWIRYLKGATSDELETLIRRKMKIYGSVPSSLGIVHALLYSVTPPGEPVEFSEATLERLRHDCLTDFVKLEPIVNRYAARNTSRGDTDHQD